MRKVFPSTAESKRHPGTFNPTISNLVLHITCFRQTSHSRPNFRQTRRAQQGFHWHNLKKTISHKNGLPNVECGENTTQLHKKNVGLKVVFANTCCIFTTNTHMHCNKYTHHTRTHAPTHTETHTHANRHWCTHARSLEKI